MRWKLTVGVGITLLALWLFWANKLSKQQKLYEIRWRVNAPITDLIPCDLDADGRDEVIIKTLRGKHWWLRPYFRGWDKALMPVKDVVATHYDAPLHFGVLVRDANNSLCFLFYRNGWQLQKLLDAPVNEVRWLDIDRDGKVNDVLALKSRTSWWFKISDNGKTTVQDKVKVPPKAHLSDFTFLSQRGKLLVTRKYVPCLTEEMPDWDGDGIAEIAFFAPSEFGDKIAVLFSKTKTLRQFILPKLRSLPIHPLCITVADLEGDGRRELVAFASDLQRIIVVDQKGQWHPTPCSVVPPFVKLWATKVGERDWIWVTEPERLWLLRRKGGGFQVRQWKLGSEDYPLAIWRDKRGIWCAIMSRMPLDLYTFGRWIAKVSDWFLSLGIPIRVPKEKLRLNLWKWDKRSDNWKRVKQIRFLSRRSPYFATLLDMNGDGQNELLMVSGRSAGVDVFVAVPEEIWLFTGQLHFIGEYYYHRTPVILRDGQRKWIVFADGKDPKILRALTLP